MEVLALLIDKVMVQLNILFIPNEPLPFQNQIEVNSRYTRILRSVQSPEVVLFEKVMFYFLYICILLYSVI